MQTVRESAEVGHERGELVARLGAVATKFDVLGKGIESNRHGRDLSSKRCGVDVM